MAQSQLNKIGNIFTRIDGLLRSGAKNYKDRPIWYDIYKMHPPKHEPGYDVVDKEGDFPIQQIFYQEDVIRAKAYSGLLKLPTYNLKSSRDRLSELCNLYLTNLKTKSEEDAIKHALEEFAEISLQRRHVPKSSRY